MPRTLLYEQGSELRHLNDRMTEDRLGACGWCYISSGSCAGGWQRHRIVGRGVHWLCGYHWWSILVGDTVGFACRGNIRRGFGEYGTIWRRVLSSARYRIVGCIVRSGIPCVT